MDEKGFIGVVHLFGRRRVFVGDRCSPTVVKRRCAGGGFYAFNANPAVFQTVVVWLEADRQMKHSMARRRIRVQSSNVKIVVFVPVGQADSVRRAMGQAGAGKTKNYTFASFSSKGVGRYRPEKGAHPTIGKVGRLELVEEERIEAVCRRELLVRVIAAIKRFHPYEEIALDVYPLE